MQTQKGMKGGKRRSGGTERLMESTRVDEPHSLSDEKGADGGVRGDDESESRGRKKEGDESEHWRERKGGRKGYEEVKSGS